jgi:hypothetical protein
LKKTEQATDKLEISPSHQITYFSFGCRRVFEGRIKENSEEKVVFDVRDREIEISPS